MGGFATIKIEQEKGREVTLCVANNKTPCRFAAVADSDDSGSRAAHRWCHCFWRTGVEH